MEGLLNTMARVSYRPCGALQEDGPRNAPTRCAHCPLPRLAGTGNWKDKASAERDCPAPSGVVIVADARAISAAKPFRRYAHRYESLGYDYSCLGRSNEGSHRRTAPASASERSSSNVMQGAS